MTYQIHRDEPTSEAIRRLATEQLDRAIGHLTDSADPQATRVHETRKRLKELRAVLRLARGSLGEHFGVENIGVRDAARALAGPRDTEAVLESVDKLKRRFTDVAQKQVLGKLRRSLVRRRARQRNEGLDDPLGDATRQLEEARSRIAGWQFDAEAFSTIEDGLAKIYRDGRRGLQRVNEEKTSEALHEWRKRVKDHWYHVQLLQEIWPAMMQPYDRVLAKLSAALGDHHDLYVLREIVQSPRAKMGTPADRLAMTDLIDARSTELEREALEIGRRVYAESSRVWLERLRSYWEMWRGEEAISDPR